MKVCIAGKNEIATYCASWLLIKGFVSKDELLVCFNKSDKEVDTFQRSFKKYSRENNLNEVSLDQLYCINELYFFSLEFDRIIDPIKFQSKKMYNIHFSLLPKYKGMYTSSWPLLNGEKKSGVTLHEIDQGIDTGDVIDQLEFIIEEDDNSRKLYFKYTIHGIDLFKRNFRRVISGNYQAKRQPALNSSYYSKSSINYAHLTIDLNKTAVEIYNQIRAFSFIEYQLPIVHGYRISSAELLNSSTNKQSGTLLLDSLSALNISTVDYDLRLIKEVIDHEGKEFRYIEKEI